LRTTDKSNPRSRELSLVFPTFKTSRCKLLQQRPLCEKPGGLSLASTAGELPTFNVVPVINTLGRILLEQTKKLFHLPLYPIRPGETLMAAGRAAAAQFQGAKRWR